ncbi:MAG: parallel beta-helix domain-containing protein [Polyangiales bacterium]
MKLSTCASLALLLALGGALGCGDDDQPMDAGFDGDSPGDVGTQDGGPDSGPDAGPMDAGNDSGPMDAGPPYPNVTCDDLGRTNEVRIAQSDSAALINAVNDLSPDTCILLAAGTYRLDNSVTIREDSITIVGQGMGLTTLSFGGVTTQVNGVDVIGDDFVIADLTVLDAPKDAIRVENSDGVTYRRVETTWTNEEDSENGAYGIYPVRCRNVLIEECVCTNASDAGLYVGQSINVIVRNNTIRGNVAGLEIENTQFADVYDNVAENNTAGIVVFDLPGNPVVGRDVRIRDNMIINNNTTNFAPGGVVAVIPAGVGTFTLASRRVEILNNTYMNNNSVDIALLSGDVVEGESNWVLNTEDLVGDWEDLGLREGPDEGTILNNRNRNIVVSGNTHMGSGTMADSGKELGLLLLVLYGAEVPSIIYGGIGESMFDADVAANNSNDNHICVGGNTEANSFGQMDIETQGETPGSPNLVIPDAPFAPFDCTELEGGPVAEVTLP